jgi:hypothetical protein
MKKHSLVSAVLFASLLASVSAFASGDPEEELTACEHAVVDAARTYSKAETGADVFRNIEETEAHVYWVSLQSSETEVNVTVDVQTEPSGDSCKVLKVEISDIAS